MELSIEWMRAIPLKRSRRHDLIYDVDLDSIESLPGVYVFARRWGSSYEALYVGRSENVRRRIRGHLNNLRLMSHVEHAKNGRRVLFTGFPLTRRGQQMPKVLATLEKAYIRHFLSEGHDLVNQQGTRIRRHEIEAVRAPRGFIPARMYLEKAGRG